MKVILAAVNAKYIHSNLAVFSLRAYAARHGQESEIAEYTINHQPEHILMDLYKRKPDVLAFSCYIWNFEMILELAEEFSLLCPQTDIWLGGPEVSWHAKKLLEQYPFLRGIMRGEGEETFLELLEYYRGKRQTLEEIRGLTFYSVKLDRSLSPIESDGIGVSVEQPESQKPASRKKDPVHVKIQKQTEGQQAVRQSASMGQDMMTEILWKFQEHEYYVIETPDRGLLPLDEVPFIYEDLQQFENRILYYETSRGCPFSCSYCLSSIDKRVRLRSFDKVRGELDFFLEHRAPQVKFVDRTFNCNKKHSRQIWSYITEHDNGVTNFHFEISADLLEEEDLALFRRMRPGLIQLEIGVQSTNPDTIRKIHRTMDLEKLRERVNAVHALHNIHQHLDLIAGLPDEDYESFRRSYGDVYAMEPEQLQLGFLKVLKGSAMEEEVAGYGIVYRRKPPYEVLYTRDLPYEDMIRLKAVEEMTEVYYNSGQFVHTLRQLVKEFDNPFDLYAALGDYYETHGLLVVSHSRIRRYDILLDFIRERFAEEEKVALYRELLTLDLYLRETVKSRPAWAKDLSPYKEAAAAFYKKEDRQRKFLKDYEGFHAGQLARMTHIEVFAYPVVELEDRSRISDIKQAREMDMSMPKTEVEPMNSNTISDGVVHANRSKALKTAVEAAQMPEIGCYPVLFDYRSRSPLTGEAAIYRLTKEDGYGDLYSD